MYDVEVQVLIKILILLLTNKIYLLIQMYFFLLNPTGVSNFLICNNLFATGFRTRRYYGGTPATHTTTIQNSVTGPLYFTQPIGVNVAPTNNIHRAVNGNINPPTVFTPFLSCVNTSFDTVWARIITANLSTLWEVSISWAEVVNENVSYSTTLNVSSISCLSLSCMNISCPFLYSNINSAIIAKCDLYNMSHVTFVGNYNTSLST